MNAFLFLRVFKSALKSIFNPRREADIWRVVGIPFVRLSVNNTFLSAPYLLNPLNDLNFTQMFLSVRRCVELMIQLPSLTGHSQGIDT